MVAFFETSNYYPECYGITSGNWDDQAISHGVLQYNFGQGTLQPLWNHLNTNYNQLCRDIFGADYQQWADLINAPLAEQRIFGTNIIDPNNSHKIINPWKDYFMTLGTSQPSIDKQIEMSDSWHSNGLKWFKNLGLYSRRAYALCFDISVFRWGAFFRKMFVFTDFNKLTQQAKQGRKLKKKNCGLLLN